MKENSVRVGVGVFVLKDGEFIMLKRRGSHSDGTWALPGGGLEFSESFEDTARREVKEETGLDIKNVRFCAVTNDRFVEEGKHYVTIWMLSEWASGEECIAEPNKCTAQAWYNFDNLPEPLFSSWQQFFESEFVDKVKQELT